MKSAIATTNLRKDFRSGRRRVRRQAVDDVSISIRAGSITGLVGPNDAGKTTLMRLVLGLARPTTGGVHLLGSELTSRTPQSLRSVGALIEEPRFYRYMSGAIVAAGLWRTLNADT